MTATIERSEHVRQNMLGDQPGSSSTARGSKRNQVVAILVSVVPMYGALIIFHLLSAEQQYSRWGFIGYLTINGTISITLIYLLQRYLIGERMRDLNLKSSRWWIDVLSTVGLVVVTLGVIPAVIRPITSRLPAQDLAGLSDLFTGLAESPLMAVLFIGPILLVGVGFEEVTRVFFLKRAWTAWPSAAAQWFNLFLSAAVFGLAHMYQGWAGAVNAGFYGLVMALYYRYRGRVIPMVMAHYLHDAIQFVMLVVLIRNGTIVL